ncbi:MAG: hypothetical protein CML04_11770 [Pseudozobellia sp.]|nr:hypothetical protein [Pseudozobellia sp.]MBG50321.1 hypothetical protein [Pseudozobellia sp.]MBG50549.1 hypothetical protein [Pseudozobellia sp.]|tara:strand:- start:118 stop:507 length:390 start_codon:yes stop_codon:yes gene_type:complete
MKRILFLTLAVLIYTNCANDDSREIRTTIIGEWRWVKSTGGLARITYTPESTGEIQKLIISSDSIKYFTNGNLISKVKYTIELIDTNGESRELIVPDPLGITQFYELKENRLTLIDYCNDCFINEYVSD